MTIRRALWIHGDGTGPDYTGEDDRGLLSAVFGGGLSDNAAAPGLGAAVGRGHGVIRGFGLTPNGTPNNTVKVAAGLAVVRGTQANDQGHYLVRNDAEVSLTVSPADGANPRRDLVIIQVRDEEYPVHTGDDAVLSIVTGTPAGSPVDPAVPEDALVLGRLAIAAGAGGEVIASGDITSPLAPLVRAVGGITPVAALADLASPVEGDVVFRTDLNRLHFHTGSAWEPFRPQVVNQAIASDDSETLVPNTNTFTQVQSVAINAARPCIAYITATASIRSSITTGDYDWRGRVQVDNTNHPAGSAYSEIDGWISVTTGDGRGYDSLRETIPWPLAAGNHTIDLDVLVSGTSAGQVSVRAAKLKVFLVEV